MGKKKPGGSRRRNGSDDESVSTSSTFPTTGSEWDAERETGDGDGDPFDMHIDALYEKRASTREGALQGLVGLMTGTYCFEDCALKQDTLMSLFLSSLRKGAPCEAQAAVRALGLHLLTLATSADSERLLEEAEPALRQVAKGGKTPSLRAAAAETLAMTVFAIAEGPAEASDTMVALRNGWGSASPPVAAAALRGWTLLASSLPAWKLDSTFVEMHLDSLSDILHSAGDVEVRTAAGQAAALLYHRSGLATLANGGEEDEEEEQEERDYIEQAALEALAPDMDDVLARMKDLATHRGDASRRSKRDRSSLKGAFRSLCGVMEDGEVKATKIKLPGGDVLVVEGMVGNLQLAAVKRYLAQGFQVHLLRNPLLHQIFGFTPSAEPAERLSTAEKRMYRSPASAESKARTQHRGKARAASSRLKGTMLNMDEEF